MLASQLIVSDFPIVHLQDKVSLALGFMEDYDVQHLPVISEDKYLGLVSKDDLLDAVESSLVALLEYQLIPASVLPGEYFLNAVKQANDFGLTIVPVITTEKELTGVITSKELLKSLGKFNGVDEPGGIIVLEMEKRNFSYGELSRLVETNDASITQLNTSLNAVTGTIEVIIKLNKVEISDILATFQRYDYTIRYYFGEESYENELKQNYDLLMTYLRM